MSDHEKTREQLILELEYLRQRAIDLVRRSNPEDEYGWLLEGYRRYRFFFEKGASLNLVITPEGLFEDVNEAFTVYFGYSKEEVIGKPVLDFIVPEDRKAVASFIEQEFSGKAIGQVPIRARAKDGTIRTVMSSSELPAAVMYKSGKPARMFAAFFDVTGQTGEIDVTSQKELKQAQDEIEDLRSQLAEQAKG